MRRVRRSVLSERGGCGPFDCDWGHASAGEAFWPEAATLVRQERFPDGFTVHIGY